MSRLTELRDAIARAEQRQAYAEKELCRFLASGSITGPEATRQHRKLREDFARARADVMVLNRTLGDEIGNMERQA